MNIYERPLLCKLGLSENFACKMLYSRQSTLGIGIIKLSTVIEIFTLKQYIGYKRMKTNLALIIDINEENVHWQYGYSTLLIKTLHLLKPVNTIQNDEIEYVLRK